MAPKLSGGQTLSLFSWDGTNPLIRKKEGDISADRRENKSSAGTCAKLLPWEVMIVITIFFKVCISRRIQRTCHRLFSRDDKYREDFRTCRKHISQTKRGLTKYYYRALCLFLWPGYKILRGHALTIFLVPRSQHSAWNKVSVQEMFVKLDQILQYW